MLKRIGNGIIACGQVDHRDPKPAIEPGKKSLQCCAAVGHHHSEAFTLGHAERCEALRLGASDIAQTCPREVSGAICEAIGDTISSDFGLLIQPIAHGALWWSLVECNHFPARAQ